MSRDRLSRLPDPVIWQILSHAPAKEAVCTGALSSTWRSLWLSSGVLNLDSRSYGAGRMRCSRSLVFIRDANAALRALAAAAEDDGENSLRKLTFTYLAPDNDVDTYLSWSDIDDGLDALLTAAPARGLEELHVHVSPLGCYSLRVANLPSDALRELHIDGLLLRPSLDAHMPSFELLETLRLRRSTVLLTELQAIVDAAPLLAALELECVDFWYEVISSLSGTSTGHRRLRCPRVTALSLGNLGGWYCGLELNMPLLRRFAYRGSLQHISFVPPPPACLALADLHIELDFFPAGANGDRRKDEACQLFWNFVGGFGRADILNVSFEQPGGRRRAEQIKELYFRSVED